MTNTEQVDNSEDKTSQQRSGTGRITSYVSEYENCHFHMKWDDKEIAEDQADSHAERKGHETFTYTEVTYVAQ